MTREQIDGHDPWEWEIAYWIDIKGVDPDKARTFTIIRWMYHGDLRPLREEIARSPVLDEAILGCLAKLIDEDRLTVKPHRHGRPKSPDKLARDIAAAFLYESRTTNNSEDTFRDIANILGKSHQSVRQAVTRWRKTNAPNAK